MGDHIGRPPGWVEAKIDDLVIRADETKAEHKELKDLITSWQAAFDARLKPLEQLRYMVFGVFMACIVVVPVIWLYASRLNALFDRMDKLLGGGKP